MELVNSERPYKSALTCTMVSVLDTFINPMHFMGSFILN